MRSSRSAFAFGFVTVGCAFGQPPLDSITAGMQDYARGITETRFDVSCKFSRFDAGGTLAKVETKTHSLAFTKGIYKNSSEDTPADWNATWYVHGGRKTLNLALITDSGALFPVFVFSPAKRKLMQFDAVPGAGDRDFSATYRPAAPCQAFKPLNKGFGMADIACGSGKIVLDEESGDSLARKLRRCRLSAGARQGTHERVPCGERVRDGCGARREAAVLLPSPGCR